LAVSMRGLARTTGRVAQSRLDDMVRGLPGIRGSTRMLARYTRDGRHGWQANGSRMISKKHIKRAEGRWWPCGGQGAG
jgi:hypothetical protein